MSFYTIFGSSSSFYSNTADFTIESEPVLAPSDIDNLSLLNNSDNVKHPPGLKLFALESGEAFIGKTPLEGSSIASSVERMENCSQRVKHLLSAQEQELLDLSAFIEIKKIDQELSDIKVAGKNEADFAKQLGLVTAYAQTINSKIKNLKPEESLWMPGGWSGTSSDNGGHAMLYQVTCQTNGHYSFTVFNTGAGIHYHLGVEIHEEAKTESKYQPFLTYSDIEASAIQDVEFIQALLEQPICPIWNKKIQCSADNIYQGILPTLNGKRVDAFDYESYPEYYMKPQRSGSCAMKVCFALLRCQMLQRGASRNLSEKATLDAYKKFKLHYQMQSLVDECYDFFSDTTWNRTEHKQISQTIAKHSRLILKGWRKKLLDKDQFDVYKATILDCEAKLAVRKSKRFESLPKPKGPSYAVDSTIEFSEGSFTQKISSIGRKEEKTASKFKDPLKVNIPSTNELNPKKLSSTISSMLGAIEELTVNKADKLLIKDALVRCINTLPIPIKGKDDFWEAVPQAQIESVLKGLFTISRELYRLSNCDLKPISFYAVIALHAALSETNSHVCCLITD